MTTVSDVSKLPEAITSFDILKSVAVVIMIIDHAGFYFFPNYQIFRAIGRTGFPVWFLMVGYARSREISPRLLVGGAILVAANFIVGFALIPLNALFTIAFIRLALNRTTSFILGNFEKLLLGSCFLSVLILPSTLLTEYGTQAGTSALLGHRYPTSWTKRERARLAGGPLCL